MNIFAQLFNKVLKYYQIKQRHLCVDSGNTSCQIHFSVVDQNGPNTCLIPLKMAQISFKFTFLDKNSITLRFICIFSNSL